MELGMWLLDGVEMRPAELCARVRADLAVGVRRFWQLDGPSGQLLTLATNGERALLMWMQAEGDAGEHLVDAKGSGTCDDFVLDNGQVDQYPVRDTVPLELALVEVAHVKQYGRWSNGCTIESDR